MKKQPGQWWDETWSPVSGCTPAGEGCRNCHSIRRMQRHLPMLRGKGNALVPPSTVICHPDRLDVPLHWKRGRVVLAPMLGDLFHEQVPFAFIGRAFGSMLAMPQHVFCVLTKRPQRAVEFLASFDDAEAWGARDEAFDRFGVPSGHPDVRNFRQVEDEGRVTLSEWSPAPRWPSPNIILLASVWDQASANAACAALSQLRGVRWGLHCEPLLGPIDGDMFTRRPDMRPSWVVCGGENGPGARPMDPRWVSALRYQCSDAGVPFWFKGWGTAKDRLLPGGGDMMATDFAQEVPW